MAKDKNLIEALKKELKHYETYGKADRAEQVKKAIKAAGGKVETVLNTIINTKGAGAKTKSAVEAVLKDKNKMKQDMLYKQKKYPKGLSKNYDICEVETQSVLFK